MAKKQTDRDKLFAKQRKERGWDDSETWSLDHTAAKFILPRLKRFREIKAGHPGDMTQKQWNKILDKMIAALEIHADGFWNADKKQAQKAIEGMELFGKHYANLWW